LAFVPPVPEDVGARLLRWLRRHREDVIKLAVLLTFALALRAVDLAHIPRNFGGDEGTQALDAVELVEPPLGNPFSTGWFSVPTMSFLAYGVAMRVFGATVAGARALSALIGAAAVLTTFLLARELWGKRVGWMAALLLACGHYHLHFSRLASNQIADGLFFTLTLWLLTRGMRTERVWTFALAGAVMGLAWYGYFGARLVMVIAALYLAWRALVEDRFLRRRVHLLALMALAALVVALPLVLHYAKHPGELTSRYDQVSIFASGWLEREQEITGRSALSLLLQQFWKSISAFNYTRDPTFWYHPAIPLLDFVSGILLVFGVVWVTSRARWPANGLLLMWFWLAVLMGWTITENPPSSQRMVVIAPALAILVALGGERLIRLLRRLVGGSRSLWLGMTAGLLGVVAVLNLGYYFLHYAPTRVYGNPTAEVADVLCDVVQGREDVPPIYFDAAPHMYWDFGAIAFRLRDVEGEDFSLETGAEAIDPTQGALFVVYGTKEDDLAQIQQWYPGGAEGRYYSDDDGRLLFITYEVGMELDG
jgi:MFS family permease